MAGRTLEERTAPDTRERGPKAHLLVERERQVKTREKLSRSAVSRGGELASLRGKHYRSDKLNDKYHGI